MTDLLAQEVNVSVISEYVAQQSDPSLEKFVYQYTVTIANEGSHPVTILARHWLITDGNGKLNEVQGDGVIGETPTIEAGDSFTYTSAAMLETQLGTMQGSYTAQGQNHVQFKIPIPVFRLEVPGVVH
ncbi:Co2+/Mg2+ efflux protein ApaG [Paraferrimonas haliotis]|uniref:Protein ApaG n=1 Tax=Paraferrimonas haliotis TaxID=2013866 RepID=A0AA37WVE6_9GAMM|nr:Co2+/Mg2+ efflux protein ApaG [Paraferrimonas haliotis]GLS82383.1 protein ApaG [Paraferrimonas haliotis]